MRGRRLPLGAAENLSTNDHRSLSEAGPQRLSSDELIAQIRAATDAGHREGAQAALAVLCSRHLPDVTRRVAMKVPRQDVEDVAMDVILSAIRSSFAGRSIGEFVNWLARITSRRIADFHDARSRSPQTQPLPGEHEGEDEVWGFEPWESDRTGEVLVESVVDECLAELSDEHRDVVERNVFDDLDAAETARLVNAAFPDLNPPMSEQNVHKIVSRFRKCVRDKLSHDEDTG